MQFQLIREDLGETTVVPWIKRLHAERTHEVFFNHRQGTPGVLRCEQFWGLQNIQNNNVGWQIKKLFQFSSFSYLATLSRVREAPD